jgi:hypothetical protein
MVGCGRKTDLVLPQSLVPVAIKDLRYSLDENGVTLQWSYPYKMETGDELTEIDSFEIFRAAMPDDDYCDGCPVRYDKPIIIDGDVLPDSGRKKTARYTEGNLQVPGPYPELAVGQQGCRWLRVGRETGVSGIPEPG